MLTTRRSAGPLWGGPAMDPNFGLNQGLACWALSLPETRGPAFTDLTGRCLITQQTAWSAGVTPFQEKPPRLGALGKPAIFTTSADFNVGSLYAFLLGRVKVTIAAWAYLTAYNSGFDFGFGGSNQRFGLQANIGAWYAITYTGSGEAYTNGSTAVSGWTHVAMVYDGAQSTASNRIALYFNGVRQSPGVSGTPPATVQTPSTQTYFSLGLLGGYSTAASNGVDDLRVYAGRALSDGEASALYVESAAGYPNALLRMRTRGVVPPSAPTGNRIRQVICTGTC